MFDAETVACGPESFADEQHIQAVAARSRLDALLRQHRRVPYEDVLAELLELPLVWERDVKDMIIDLRKRGELEIEGLRPRERTPKPGHVLVSVEPAGGAASDGGVSGTGDADAADDV